LGVRRHRSRPSSFRMRIGIGLLVAASLLLVAAGVYTHYALRNPKNFTFYQPYSTPYIEPRISAREIIAFVVIEHVLVGFGLACLLKSLR
jgi:Sec-independent protein secretion pathway component TatC